MKIRSKQTIEAQQNQEALKHKEILSRTETAKLLGINLSTLWKWTRDSKLTSYGLGHKVFYKYSEVVQALTPLNTKD
ncbi:MAG: helix-turn-helix domain-containing protein [Cytophagales bacterium]|nr:helix-turn-helix domain-containing protein [Cytophagales bacterium]